MPIDPNHISIVINGVGCTEGVAGYEEAAGPQGPECNKTYFCNWPDRYRVANGLLGFSTIVGGRYGYTKFTPPTQHPESPNMYVHDVRITGKGRPYHANRNVAFDVAEIRARFIMPEYGILPTDDPERRESIDPDNSFVYATQSIDVGEESIEIPVSKLQYGSGTGADLRVPYRSFSLPFAHAILSITFHKLPYIPVATFPVYNFVNEAKFMGCDRGKVKFKGSRTQRTYGVNQIDGSQTVTQEVTNSYHYRPAKEWNYFPDPNPVSLDGWIDLRYRGGGFIFPYTDLSVTFPNGYAV